MAASIGKVIEKVLASSGLAQGEFGQIVGVSRVMVNRYIKRDAQPTGNNERRIDRAISLLNSLVKSGRLPLKGDVDQERRKRAVLKIQQHLDARG